MSEKLNTRTDLGGSVFLLLSTETSGLAGGGAQ